MKYLLDHFKAEPNDTLATLRVAVSKRLNLPSNSIRIEILSRYLSWNVQLRKMEIVYDLSVDTNEFIRDTTVRFLPEVEKAPAKTYGKKLPPVIVGAGFTGLAAALSLAKAGAKPIVIERCKESFNTSKTPQNEDEINTYGGFHGRNGALFIHERTPIGEDIFQRLIRAGRVQPINKDRYHFLSPEECVGLTTNMIAEIRKLGGEVLFDADWIGCDYFLGKLKRVRYVRNGKEEQIKTNHLVFATSALDPTTASCLVDSKISLRHKKNHLGLIIEYPYSEYKSAFLKGMRTTWPHFFIEEKFSGKDGRAISFTGPYLHGEIHSHGHLAPNELRFALDGKDETATVKFILSVELSPAEAKLVAREDAISPLFYMTLRKDRPLSAPVEMVTDFVTKREPWKLGRTKPSYKKGVFMSNLHSFLDNSISDSLQYGMVHINRNYPLFASSNGLVYGFIESGGSAFEIVQEDFYTSKRGVFALQEPQNLTLNLNQSLQAGEDIAAFLLDDA